MLTHFTKTISAATLIALAAFCAQAAEIEVKMLNKGSDGQTMVFEPALIKANVGDVIRFIPVDKGHDAAAIKDLIPEGASVFKGKINQQIEVTVEKDGAYVVKCTPHFGMGMVALIIAGDDAPENLEKIKTAKMPKKARERLDAEISAAGF